MNQTYLRGDMYYADLGQGIGSEQEGYPVWCDTRSPPVCGE